MALVDLATRVMGDLVTPVMGDQATPAMADQAILVMADQATPMGPTTTLVDQATPSPVKEVRAVKEVKAKERVKAKVEVRAAREAKDLATRVHLVTRVHLATPSPVRAAKEKAKERVSFKTTLIKYCLRPHNAETRSYHLSIGFTLQARVTDSNPLTTRILLS